MGVTIVGKVNHHFGELVYSSKQHLGQNPKIITCHKDSSTPVFLSFIVTCGKKDLLLITNNYKSADPMLQILHLIVPMPVDHSQSLLAKLQPPRYRVGELPSA